MKGGFIPQFKWVLPQVVGSESFKELCRSLELRWKKGWRTARQNHVRRQKKNTNNETSWNKVKWQCGNCCSPLMSPGLGVRSFWKIGIYISWKCILYYHTMHRCCTRIRPLAKRRRLMSGVQAGTRADWSEIEFKSKHGIYRTYIHGNLMDPTCYTL